MNRLFQTAVARAQAESRLMEVPNVYFMNGELYYERPDGQLTTKTPEIYQAPALQTNR